MSNYDLVRLIERKKALKFVLNNLLFLYDVVNLTDTQLLELIEDADDDIEKKMDELKKTHP